MTREYQKVICLRRLLGLNLDGKALMPYEETQVLNSFVKSDTFTIMYACIFFKYVNHLLNWQINHLPIMILFYSILEV